MGEGEGFYETHGYKAPYGGALGVLLLLREAGMGGMVVRGLSRGFLLRGVDSKEQKEHWTQSPKLRVWVSEPPPNTQSNTAGKTLSLWDLRLLIHKILRSYQISNSLPA